MNPSAATCRAPEVRADTLLDDGSACDTFVTRRSHVTTNLNPCQHFFARHAKSLKAIFDGNNSLKPVRFSMSDYREQEWMVNVPLYLVSEWIEAQK